MIHRRKTALGLEFESRKIDSAQKTPDGRCHWFETHLSVHLLSAGTQTGCTSDPGMQFCDGVSFTLCHRCISGYATVAYPDMQRWHKVNDTPSHLEDEAVPSERKRARRPRMCQATPPRQAAPKAPRAAAGLGVMLRHSFGDGSPSLGCCIGGESPPLVSSFPFFLFF